MKKFFTCILIAVTAVFSLLLASCDDGGSGNTEKKNDEKVVLGVFEDLADFTIVRGDNGTQGEKDAVVELRKLISEKFGVELNIATDYSGEKSKEILVGKTIRRESKMSEADVNTASKYVIRRSGDKVIIMGGSDEAIMTAVNFWVNSMVNGEGKLCIPKNANGYVYAPDVKFSSIDVCGVNISEYKFLNTDSSFGDNIAKLKKELFEYADVKIETVKSESAAGHYIKFEKSVDDAKKSYVSFDDGDIVFGCSFYDYDWGVEYFISMLENAESEELHIGEDREAENIFEIKPLYNKEQLLKALEQVYNSDNVIIGTELSNYPSMVSTMLDKYYEASGEYPGILGFDIRYANLVKLGDEGIARVVAELTSYAQNGGIVTASAHFSNPTLGDPAIENYRGTFGGDDAWAELITEGTAYNTSFKKELEGIADFFTLLRDNGVPVIWRPLHETNANFFWFGMVQKIDGNLVKVSEKSFSNLWIYIHDYFTIERGLDNLLWEFGPNIGEESDFMTAPLYGFPGLDYVDLCGFDWYTGDGNPETVMNSSTYKDLKTLGLVINMNEFGPSGDLVASEESEIKQEDIFSCEDILGILTELGRYEYKLGYLLTWTDPISIPKLGKADVLMQSELAIGQAEVRAIFEGLN